MKRRTLIVIMLFASTLAALCPTTTEEANEQYIFMAKKHLYMASIYSHSLTPKLLLDALYYLEIKEPEIVYKQAILETGNFTSDIYVNANNVFGMRLARVRETTAIGEYNYHALYVHWFDSVRDYRMLQDYYLDRGYSFTEYLLFLELIGYATDPLYVTKLNNISDAT